MATQISTWSIYIENIRKWHSRGLGVWRKRFEESNSWWMTFSFFFFFFLSFQSITKYNNAKIQLEISSSRQHDKNDPTQLTMDHLVGIFILWSMGISISIIVFIVELIMGKLKSGKKKKSKFIFLNWYGENRQLKCFVSSMQYAQHDLPLSVCFNEMSNFYSSKHKM